MTNKISIALVAAALLTVSGHGSSFSYPWADVDQGQGKEMVTQTATILQVDGDLPCNEVGYTMQNSYDPETDNRLNTDKTTERFGCYPLDPNHIPFKYPKADGELLNGQKPKPEWANGVCYTGSKSGYNAKHSNSGERLAWAHCQYDTESVITTAAWPDGETTVTTPLGETLTLPPPGTLCAKRWNFNPGFLDDGVTNDLPDYVTNACVPTNGYYKPDARLHSQKVRDMLEVNNTFWCFTGKGSDSLLDDAGYNPKKENSEEDQKQVEWAFCVDPLAVEETSGPTTAPTSTTTTAPPNDGPGTRSPTATTTTAPPNDGPDPTTPPADGPGTASPSTGSPTPAPIATQTTPPPDSAASSIALHVGSLVVFALFVLV